MGTIPTEFTPEKVRRKLRADGVSSTAVTAADLFVRKRIGRRVLDPMINRRIVRVLSRQSLKDRATAIIDVGDRVQDGSTRFVSAIGGGYVLSETGLAMTSEFEVIQESADTPDHARQAIMAMLSRELFFGQLPIRGLLRGTPPRDPPVLDTVAPLIPRYPTNYYHWMVETVPKVRYLQMLKQQTGTDVTVLVPDNAPPFVEETLSRIGWPKKRIEYASEPMYEIRNLIVPPYPERSRAELDWLRETILDGVLAEETTVASGSNIYVSRSNAIARRVVNEDAVMEVLEPYGFERYHLEDRSLAENVRLFNSADVVVGPHGAGLTDIIFTEDCTLVEMFGARLNKAYEKLSKTLDVMYDPMYCQTNGVDIVVDTDELSDRISNLAV